MLEGLEHPSQVPTNPAGGGPSPGLDIASLYGDSYPPAAPASDPFGLGGLDGPSPAPVPTYDFGLPPPAIGRFPHCLEVSYEAQMSLCCNTNGFLEALLHQEFPACNISQLYLLAVIAER